MTYDPPPLRGADRPYFGHIARRNDFARAPTDAERYALAALVEGAIGAQQPIRFIRHIFNLHLLGLIERRDGAYHLTDAGRAALKETRHP
jgi:hypothetical protein